MFTFIIIGCNGDGKDELIVMTTYGLLKGSYEDDLYIFRGIPFAKPPTGALRFRAPEKPESWSGVRYATEYGPSAPQVDLGIDFVPGMDVGLQSEDCLYLNVFTPATDNRRRPVLVWLHPGGFTSGSGSQEMYDVRPLTRYGDVVTVTLNYRLGALGFLYLGDLGGEEISASGNAGLLDQIAALEWVRDNIVAFGGDPSNVTIFGESAGGMSVGTLFGTPDANGLFHRAIAQSGAAHNVHSADDAMDITEQFLNELDIPITSVEMLLEVSVERILEAQEPFTFQPVVDGSVLPKPPLDAIRDGLSQDIPLLVGTCRDEYTLLGLIYGDTPSLDNDGELADYIENLVPGLNPSEAQNMVKTYREEREALGLTPTSTDLYFAIQTDRAFRIPAIRLVEAQYVHQPKNTWLFLFTWESVLLGGTLGAHHGVDLPFVFGLTETSGALITGGGPEAETLSLLTMDAWLAFAHSGNPNHADLPEWQPYDESKRATMLFGEECALVEAPADATRLLWDSLL